MIKFVTMRLPEGIFVKLCFTRMTEEDTWMCQMDDDTMNDIQKIIGQDFYGSF
jgi:hypothetical protein